MVVKSKFSLSSFASLWTTSRIGSLDSVLFARAAVLSAWASLPSYEASADDSFRRAAEIVCSATATGTLEYFALWESALHSAADNDRDDVVRAAVQAEGIHPERVDAVLSFFSEKKAGRCAAETFLAFSRPLLLPSSGAAGKNRNQACSLLVKSGLSAAQTHLLIERSGLLEEAMTNPAVSDEIRTLVASSFDKQSLSFAKKMRVNPGVPDDYGWTVLARKIGDSLSKSFSPAPSALSIIKWFFSSPAKGDELAVVWLSKISNFPVGKPSDSSWAARKINDICAFIPEARRLLDILDSGVVPFAQKKIAPVSDETLESLAAPALAHLSEILNRYPPEYDALQQKAAQTESFLLSLCSRRPTAASRSRKL